MTTTAFALEGRDSEQRAVAIVGGHGGVAMDWSTEDVQALKDTIAKDCNPAQLKVFIIACQRLGLDPFARQITPLVLNGKMTPQITIDGFRLIAERTRKYAGQLGPFWCGTDGEWHEVWLLDTDPVACKVGILRRDFTQPLWGVARTKAYKSDTPTWKKMPDVMIAKVAESLALRKAFPQELSGVYSDVEMDQARDDTQPVSRAQTRLQQTDRDTGEITFTVEGEPHVAAPPAKGGTKLGALRDRFLATGRTEQDWAAQCLAKTGTTQGREMKPDGWSRLVAYVEHLEHAQLPALEVPDLADIETRPVMP